MLRSPNPSGGRAEIGQGRTDLEDALHASPPWLTYAGVAVVVLTTVLLLAGAALLPIREYVTAPATLTTVTAPAPMVTPIEGVVVRLRFRDGEQVPAQAIVAIVGSLAQVSAVERTQAYMAKVESALSTGSLPPSVPYEVAVGGIGPELAALAAAAAAARGDRLDDPLGRDIARARAEEETARRRLQILQQQRHKVEALSKIAAADLARRQDLVKSGWASEASLTTYQRAMIAADQAENEHGLDMETTRAAIEAAAGRIRDADADREQRRRTHDDALREALIRLGGAIDRWEAEHVIRAPTSGRIDYFGTFAEGQMLAAREQIALISPNDERYAATARVPAHNFARVMIGQEVRVALDDYPTAEYGFASGKVSHISASASSGIYLVEITLPKVPRTETGFAIKPKQGMPGRVEFIVGRSTLARQWFRGVRPWNGQ